MNPAALLLCATLAVAGAGAQTEGEKRFTERVRPLLDSRCVSCHGGEKQKGGLRLDSREAALRGGENGPAILPGQPARSLLLQTVLHQKKDLEMPPKEKLSAKETGILEKWIADGAPWPLSPEAASLPRSASGERLGDAWSDPRNPIIKIFGGQRLDLWSLKPRATSPASPPRGKVSKSENLLDHFIAARLAEKRLRPAPAADSRTLIRRMTYDLTGLPPTPEEVDAFILEAKRDAPAAARRLADRLLASPRYGEHQARQWLDVIRYSDSNGFDWDEFRKEAWRFRDYVVRSFNADKPFDRFIREQIAGDELLDGPPRTPAEQDLLLATGFLRLGPHDNAAPLFNEQDRSRAELLTDLTETTGAAFLGLTLSCCRCHDHKTDPLSQADHYRLRAFFAPVKFADDLALDLAHEQAAIRQLNDELDAHIKPLQQQRDALLEDAKKILRTQRLAQLSSEERALLDSPSEKMDEAAKKKADALRKKTEPSDKDARAALDEVGKKLDEELSKQADALAKQKRKTTRGLLMTDNTEKIPDTKIFFQGSHKEPRESVEPGFLSILDPNPASPAPALNKKSTGRRLALAEWIASPANPLTARVFVNRVWQQHFGRGLVANPNDFGLAAARPTHPELLDWLAGEFIREGGSVKKLHRLIVTSATYRQSSGAPPASDAENTLLSRQNPRRLSAEQLRDALLAVAGTLKLDHTNGPPIWPELPKEILQANPAFLDDNETRTKGWYPSPSEMQAVRSLFLVQKRTVRVPFMETFDLPENSASCARRAVSTVAPQALTLLNDRIAVQAAQDFAARLRREAGESHEAQIRRAFALAYQRAPTAAEQASSERFLAERTPAEFCRALMNLNEFAYVD